MATLSTSAETAKSAAASRWIVRHAISLVGLLLFGLYLPTLAPGATFSDGPEIVTAIHTLGVIHPTGYPLFTMVAHGFTRLLALPLETCVKVELFNALCASIAAVLTALSARDVILAAVGEQATARQRSAANLAGALAGLLLGVAPLLWAQVRIAEVYPFHVLLVTWGGYSWIRFATTRKSRYVLSAALAMGMGLAHHVTMVYMLPAGAILLLATRPSMFVSWLLKPPVWLARKLKPGFAKRLVLHHPWLFPVACVIGALPLLSYAYLLWANEHTAGVPWGSVDNWEHLYNHATGAQYSRFFMDTKDLAWYFARAKKIPDVFDQQFLPPGTIAFFIGLAVTVRFSWRHGLFLLAYMLFNLGHGMVYSVGDFQTYLLPGIFCCSVIIGVGAYWLLDYLRTLPAASRMTMCLSAVGITLATTAVSMWGYARYSRRVPEDFRDLALGAGSTAMGVVAAMVLIFTSVVTWRKLLRQRKLSAEALPRVAMALAALGLTLVVFARGYELATAKVVGKSYGAELSALIPPGSMLLTQGDGFLFTMWHEQHVLGRGRDFATIDLGNIRTPWYERYLYSRHPRQCDPLWGEHAGDAAAFAQHCGSYRKRVDLKEKPTWVGLYLRSGRTPKGVKAKPGEIRSGADPRCAEETFNKEHGTKECRCRDYAKKPGELMQYCVYSFEEQGIVARSDTEVRAQRLIEDFIDERPIFERNALMFWAKDKTINFRGWNGPQFQRLTALYAYVNRGRFNQIVYAEDLARTRPCAPNLDRIPLRKHKPPRTTRRRYTLRQAYRPNPNPILITASFLTKEADGNDDDATRHFDAGDRVHMHIHWFERYKWDNDKPDHRGDKLRHGIRLCLYQPDGNRIAAASIVSGDKEPGPSFELPADAPSGSYHLQGCSLGDVGERAAPLPDSLPCQRTLLDYEFRVNAP